MTAFAQAEAWLADQERRTCGVSIQYRRNAQVIALLAVAGETRVDAAIDDAGTTIRRAYLDWLIIAGSLTAANGNRLIPQLGDLIEESKDGQTIVYAVTQIGDEPCWRWSGREQIVRRVHTRLESREQ